MVEWQNMPANYIYMQDLNQPGPLKKRVDTPTGIAGRGELALVATQDEFRCASHSGATVTATAWAIASTAS